MCPYCGDRLATILGYLGSLLWLRCRACGMDYSTTADEVSDREYDIIADELENREHDDRNA